MGAMGGNNDPLPSGPQLRDSLLENFSVEAGEEAISLSRAYTAANRRDPERLRVFMNGWFTGCTPGWQHILADFAWHRVWTLNIDDIVEKVYEARSITFDRFDWTSRHRDRSNSPNQVIHLHGFARETSGPESESSNLVFSISDYASTLLGNRTWHAVFVDEFAELPFIILGASLIDEFDLQRALQAGSTSTNVRGLPSIIVLKSVTDLQREELSALGLLVVEADANEFLMALRTKCQDFMEELGRGYGQNVGPEVSKFLQQFVDLRRFEPLPSTSQHDFYSGYEPHWKNILDDDDALLETTERALSKILETSDGDEAYQVIHIITGGPGTGKSTALLRIARDLMAQNKLPFAFRGDEELDVGAVLHWVKRLPSTVLLFDNCADFAQSLARLASECESLGLRITIVGAERTSRRKMLEDRIDQRFLHMGAEYEYSLLSRRDISALIEKLETRRRLGRITRISASQRHDYFWRTASRRLFEGMANLEGGQGFQTRIQRAYQLIQEEHLKTIYAASSIAFQLGHPLSLGVSSKIAGLPVRQLEYLLNSSAQDVMVITPQGVRPPHRITASIVVDTALSEDERFEAVHRLMFALAPHVDVNAIRNLTRNYRLLRQLMDEETVIRLVGRDRGRELFGAIQDIYDWNGRYWDQRALFESRLGNHAQARSYAERSLQIQRHPFAFNTLGTVLGRAAIQNGDINTLRESIHNLKDARDRRAWNTSEHPYMTFFTTMIRFGQERGLASIPNSLRNEWADWFNNSQRETLFSHPEGRQQLEKFQIDWLSLATA